MNATDLVAKTAAGSDELKTRARGLSQRLRTVLIMADGAQTVEQVRSASAGLGLAPDFLESLLAEGLIELRPRSGGRGPSRPAAPASGPLSRPAPLGGVTSVDIPTGPADPAAQPPAGTEAERFLRARQYMNDKVVDSLKLRAFFFVLKLEKCSTRQELAELLPDFEKALTKASGAEVAEVIAARARELLR